MTDRTLPWLGESLTLPDTAFAWPADSEAPGLLAAGSRLDADMLEAAYARGIFPWFSEGEPVLWWSPDPRMVLRIEQFKCHRSLRQAIRSAESEGARLRLDHDFEGIMRACAEPRAGQSGTWITEQIVAAYSALHARGLAHSLGLWLGEDLLGGLYCVGMGSMVFGESMFSRRPNASKICLAALVAYVGQQGGERIDCQQQTQHLASLGASPIPRAEFETDLRQRVLAPALCWDPDRLHWQLLNETHGQPTRSSP